MNKKILSGCVVVLLVVGGAFLLIPLLASLAPSRQVQANSTVLVDMPNIQEGYVEIVDVAGKPLFLLRPNGEQRAAINELNSHVWDASSIAFNEQLGAYVYWGLSTKHGFALRHMPPEQPPIYEWDKNAKWLGGYWEWAGEVSYDYSGRAIKTYSYTYNGYTAHYKNLEVPEYLRKVGDKLEVSIYERRKK